MNTASVEFMDLRNDSTQFKAFADDCGFEDPCVGVPTSEGDECDDKCECDIREDWTKLLKAMQNHGRNRAKHVKSCTSKTCSI